MKKLTISGGNNTSQLFIGEDYQNFKKYLPQKGQVIVLTDEKVRKLYGEAFKEYPIISIGQTEQIKTLETIDAIIDQLISFKADRTSFLLAVGGGIVCDIVGFAASIYQRGIRFGFISTTLLSQVDASVGGKNGVNHRGFKNMIGVFNQPDFVICDPKMLQTLGTEELSCGFAEIVKHTLIADKAMFEWLEKNYTKAIALHPDGKKCDSLAFSKLLCDKIAIQFFIGGAFGFEESFVSRCDSVISLSELTMSHKIAKAVLLEQIYRAFTLLNNHPYHK